MAPDGLPQDPPLQPSAGDGETDRARLLSALRTGPALIAIVRAEGLVYEWVSDRYRELIGDPSPEGKRWGLSRVDTTAANARAHVERCVRTGEPHYAVEAPLRVPAGEGLRDGWFDVTLHPQRDANGVVESLVIQAVDRTADVLARKAAALLEEKLQKVTRLESLAVLAGGIAHDFGNLLTGVLGNASFALGEVTAGSAAHAALTDVIASAKRAAELTGQLLVYSGKGRFRVERLDLCEHVRSSAQLLAASLPANARLSVAIGETKLPVDCDPAQARQLLENLVLNAAEALEGRNGTITVRTGEALVEAGRGPELTTPEPLAPGAYAVLSVADDGSGMTAEVQKRIFEPFFTTRFAGRGLGLPAALGIARGHKGGIRVESAEGRGTAVHVYLPLAAQPPPKDAPAPAQQPGVVLLIDDDRAVRQVARRMIEMLGFAALEASSGDEALAMLASRPDVTVAVLDLSMPGLSGAQTFAQLRRLRPGLPVVISSGYDEDEETRALLSAGGVSFLPKPYRPAGLQAALEAALR